MTAAVRRDGLARFQGHVHVDLAQEEHRAALAVEHQRVLAAPALAAAPGQLGFQHRRRVGEHAVPQRPDLLRDALAQLLQARAQHLVVVAPPGVDRDDGLLRALQARELHGLPARRHVHGRGARQVVHARRDHAHRARHQLGRSRALEAVRLHVMHLAMEPLRQPLHQPLLGAGREIDAGDADLGESQLACAHPCSCCTSRCPST
jgi:hypothetical protein